MLALGIDPGTAICGYGFVESKGSRLIPRAYGSIFTTPNMKMEDRLLKIHTELDALIKKYQPDVMGVEKLFFNRNVTTAIMVGEARGVAILACNNSGIDIAEYTPGQIKQAVTGYGKAEKKQVQFMVKSLLGLKEVPKPDDTADAVAAAICHGFSAQGAASSRLAELIAKAK